MADMERRFDSADEAIRGICRDLLLSGERAAPRGKATREITPYSFVLTRPRARRISLPARGWNEALAVGELCWHLSASDEVGFIGYYAKAWADFSDDGRSIKGSCYGKKLFGGAEGPSKWDLAKRELQQDPVSRRALVTIGDTIADLGCGGRDIPCVSAIQFLLRRGALHCIAFMRSNDVIWGLSYDLFLLTMLQERMACELGVRLGTYAHVAASMHIYDSFLPMAEEIIASPASEPAPAMPRMEALDQLQDFLDLEKMLRLGVGGSGNGPARLHPYWRQLAAPLVALHERRWGRSQSRDQVLCGH
jgi:thymidylate synthase